MRANKNKSLMKIKRLANFLIETGRKNPRVKAWYEKHNSVIEELTEDENSPNSGSSKMGFYPIFSARRN